MATNSTSSGGIGLGGVLFIVFLVLKLTGTITWSWWWITAPLWGGFALALGIIAVTAAVALPFVWLFSRAAKRLAAKQQKSFEERLSESAQRFENIR